MVSVGDTRAATGVGLLREWSALRGNLRPLHVYTGVLTPPGGSRAVLAEEDDQVAAPQQARCLLQGDPLTSEAWEASVHLRNHGVTGRPAVADPAVRPGVLRRLHRRDDLQLARSGQALGVVLIEVVEDDGQGGRAASCLLDIRTSRRRAIALCPPSLVPLFILRRCGRQSPGQVSLPFPQLHPAGRQELCLRIGWIAFGRKHGELLVDLGQLRVDRLNLPPPLPP